MNSEEPEKPTSTPVHPLLQVIDSCFAPPPDRDYRANMKMVSKTMFAVGLVVIIITPALIWGSLPVNWDTIGLLALTLGLLLVLCGVSFFWPAWQLYKLDISTAKEVAYFSAMALVAFGIIYLGWLIMGIFNNELDTRQIIGGVMLAMFIPSFYWVYRHLNNDATRNQSRFESVEVLFFRLKDPKMGFLHGFCLAAAVLAIQALVLLSD